MPKILKNQTVSAIEIADVGATLEASPGTYTIPETDYLYWAASADIVTPVTSGDVVVNDGTNDLSANEGLRFLKYADRPEIQDDGTTIQYVNKTINFTGPGLTVTDQSNGKVDVASTDTAVGSLVPYLFLANGNTADKWLGHSESSFASNVIPLILPQDSDVKGFTFSNADDDVDIDAELYINGVLEFTWEIRNKRTAIKVGISPAVSANQGDRLSIFLRKYTGGTGDNTAQSPQVVVLAKVIGESAADTGTQFGV